MENKTIILIAILVIGVLIFLRAKPKEMGGEIEITEIPDSVKPDSIFNIQGTFIPSADGYYLLEAGPVLCPGGCQGNVFDRAALITADKSACDGNVHYSGIFQEMNKGEKYSFSFNLKSSDILGEYEYKVYAYDKCEKDGGILLSSSEVKKVLVSTSAREQENLFGNKEGTINGLYEGTGNFLSLLGTTWNNMGKYTKSIVGGMALIFITVLLVFKEPRKR